MRASAAAKRRAVKARGTPQQGWERRDESNTVRQGRPYRAPQARRPRVHQGAGGRFSEPAAPEEEKGRRHQPATPAAYCLRPTTRSIGGSHLARTKIGSAIAHSSAFFARSKGPKSRPASTSRSASSTTDSGNSLQEPFGGRLPIVAHVEFAGRGERQRLLIAPLIPSSPWRGPCSGRVGRSLRRRPS